MIPLGYSYSYSLNPSGQAHVGEGYFNRSGVYQSLEGQFLLKPKPYPYKILNSETNFTFFPLTIRSLNENGSIQITSNISSGGNTNIAELNVFLTGVYGFRLVGSVAHPKSTFSYPGVTWGGGVVPQARDALAYNLIKYNREIPSLFNWTWFKVSNTEKASGIFGPCIGDRPASRAENYDGFYTNIYAMEPSSEDIWLYNYTTPHTSTIVNLINGTVSYLGGVTWLISGTPSVYINDGKPIYWSVETYNFSSYNNNTRLLDTSRMQEIISDSSINIGLPPSGSKFLDLSVLEGRNSDSMSATYKSRFFWSGSISRWVFNIRANDCNRGATAPIERYVTGLDSTNYPWETSWPSGIQLNLLN